MKPMHEDAELGAKWNRILEKRQSSAQSDSIIGLTFTPGMTIEQIHGATMAAQRRARICSGLSVDPEPTVEELKHALRLKDNHIEQLTDILQKSRDYLGQLETGGPVLVGLCVMIDEALENE